MPTVKEGTTVREIVKGWLDNHGYDGLCNPDAECACGVDWLLPCNSPCDKCQAAYKLPCDECAIQDECTNGDSLYSVVSPNECYRFEPKGDNDANE